MNMTSRQLLFLLLSLSGTVPSSSSAISQHATEQDFVHCETLWMGGSTPQNRDNDSNDDIANTPGKLCVQLTRSNPNAEQPHHLTVFHLLNDKHGYILDESYLWVGSDPSNMPRSLASWPFYYHVNTTTHDTTSIKSDLTVNIPLDKNNSAPQFCQDGQDTTTVYLAVHPVILQQSTHRSHHQYGVPETSISGLPVVTEPNTRSLPKLQDQPNLRRASATTGQDGVSSRHQDSGVWWMELELTVQGLCNQEHASSSSVSPHQPRIVQLQQRQRRLDWQSSRRRLSSGCHGGATRVSRIATLEDTAADPTNQVLTESFIHQFHIITTLSAHVAYDTQVTRKEDYYRTIYDQFYAYNDGLNDAAIVAKVDNICYGVFRGTVEYNYFDEMQNLLPGYRKVDGTDCYVRRGLYDAYFTNYATQFEDSVRDCVNSCDDGDCELVFTGGSQGAAVAVVASIRFYQEFDPTVMSMGVMRTFLPTSPFDDHAPCTHVNEEKHYHFVLTDDVLKAYDPIPYVYAFWAKNVGHEILYDGNGNFNYQGLAPNYIMRREPGNYAIHTRWNYVVKSQRAYENACLPYPAYGWVDGHWCTDHDNCMPTSYCSDIAGSTCQPKLEVGSDCHNSDACLSGSCVDGICFMVSKKQLLTPIGNKCWTNGQCGSGRCEGFIGFSTCQMQLESGASCNEHSDCLSGHCAGMIDGKCL
ncbi:expressed unknown protein [Seminavis robusta]|uniref:Fungal lipase-type domain-containing protein n=1 Tax=Seminavis robusta TaxID=568900 RepID=A0A9N8DC41_9STRA|nr:expressed unknown protein [Seminavis robusta]|eukprot:Sro76_g041610.1 n/a (697) ;mRNA; r:52397-54487